MQRSSSFYRGSIVSSLSTWMALTCVQAGTDIKHICDCFVVSWIRIIIICDEFIPREWPTAGEPVCGY